MRPPTNHNCIAQLSLAGLAWVTALALSFNSSLASEGLSGQAFDIPGTRITVYGPHYVLENFTHREGADLVFVDREGVSWTLIEDPSSPVISNRGDGRFHPFDPADVASACEWVSYPLDGLEIEIFVLPYPRGELLDCSAKDGAIYLSPGMYEVHEAHAHMIVTHELGHCVQYKLMPDSGRNLWERYRELRQISDFSRYNSSSPHAMRPHEIFAEDFRWLFGGGLSKYSGTIENKDLVLPTEVSGLGEFMLSLAEQRLARSSGPRSPIELEIINYPNPFRKTTTVSLNVRKDFSAIGYAITSTSARAVVYDAAGRSVKDLGSHQVSGNATLQFRWDGKDDAGRQLPSGVYFLRVSFGQGIAGRTHKMVLNR